MFGFEVTFMLVKRLKDDLKNWQDNHFEEGIKG
jgi:hypothetical protein